MHPLLKKTVSCFVLACLLLFTTNRLVSFKQGFLEHTAAKITYPFLWVSGWIASTVHAMTTKRDTYHALQEKYTQLNTNYMNMLDELIALQAHQHLYENIKELVEFKARYDHDNSVLAKVLVKNIASNEHYFLVNRGTRDGVSKDMVVLFKNHLIGRVSDAYDFYSKVILITDQHCKIAAYTSKTRADGIVHGYNCINRCKLTYVSHLFKIENNDLVISSGQGLVFPEGFCLGKIVQHSLQEKSLYHSVEIEPMVNLATINHCLIANASSIRPL